MKTLMNQQNMRQNNIWLPEQSLRRSTALCCFGAAKRDILAVVVEEMIPVGVTYYTLHRTQHITQQKRVSAVRNQEGRLYTLQDVEVYTVDELSLERETVQIARCGGAYCR